ncbi:MAG: FAD-dependent monooxygenase [Halocynthiibacter sp.]
MEHRSDITIVGGGLNGPALALALADTGHMVTIIDAAPDEARSTEGFDGRGYALSLASQRLLKAIDIWPKVAQNAQPILEIKVSDGEAGKGASPHFLHFDHAEIEEGPMGYMLEDRFLYGAFQERLKTHPKITIIRGAKAIAQDTDAFSATVTLGQGDVVHSKLIIGCDGRQSGTAARAGITRSGHDYGQTGLVCAIETEHPHNGTAHQFFMPPGPLAILPLPGNFVSIVWTETTEAAKRIVALSDEDYLKELKPRFGSFMGDIKLAGDRFAYPLNLTLADRFVTERVALVGDAAHGVHYIAGQGLNLGLKDVAALAEILTNAKRRGEDIGAINILERYQTWRRFDTTTLVAATEGVNTLFSNDNGALRAVREMGLGLVNAMPKLRRSLIRQAAGLEGEMPKLLQGRQI